MQIFYYHHGGSLINNLSSQNSTRRIFANFWLSQNSTEEFLAKFFVVAKFNLANFHLSEKGRMSKILMADNLIHHVFLHQKKVNMAVPAINFQKTKSRGFYSSTIFSSRSPSSSVSGHILYFSPTHLRLLLYICGFCVMRSSPLLNKKKRYVIISTF